MRPRNLPHWVISLTLPLSGVTFTACAGDQEAGEMEEFDQGNSKEMSEGDSSKKKKKKKMMSKKKKKMKTMKGANGGAGGKKKKKMMKKAGPAASQQDADMDGDM